VSCHARVFAVQISFCCLEGEGARQSGLDWWLSFCWVGAKSEEVAKAGSEWETNQCVISQMWTSKSIIETLATS
jgi:hypothetical protein